MTQACKKHQKRDRGFKKGGHLVWNTTTQQRGEGKMWLLDPYAYCRVWELVGLNGGRLLLRVQCHGARRWGGT